MDENLLSTVNERYRRVASYRGLFTLVYHEKGAKRSAADNEENRRRGLLSFLRPQLAGVSKQIHDEVNRILDRRDKLILQTVSRDMPQMVGKNMARLKEDSVRHNRAQADRTFRLEKRVELVNADVAAKFKALQKELERHKAKEKERERDEESSERERQIKEKHTRQRESRSSEREREEFRRDISIDITRAERKIWRKLREDEEYEKRRRG